MPTPQKNRLEEELEAREEALDSREHALLQREVGAIETLLTYHNVSWYYLVGVVVQTLPGYTNRRTAKTQYVNLLYTFTSRTAKLRLSGRCRTKREQF